MTASGIAPTAADRMFAAAALKKRVDAAVRELREECDAMLLGQYEASGVTQMRSQLFGKDAGSYTVPIESARPESSSVDYRTVDMGEFEEWAVENPDVLLGYALANPGAVAAWCQSATGEVPGGVVPEVTRIPAVPEHPGTPRLKVDADAVFARLDELGMASLQSIDRLLLGGGGDGD